MFMYILYKYVQMYVSQSSSGSTEDFIGAHFGALTQKTGIGHLHSKPGNMLQVCRALLGICSQTDQYAYIGHT